MQGLFYFIGGKMYQPLSKKNVFEAEKEQRDYWQELDLLQKTLDHREGNKHFVFYEGPPTANGKPGLHHVLARTLKDSICRYKVMQGYYVRRKAGWDTHGLPVEIEVEKKLGITNKQEIEAYGIAEFNKQCRESVFEYEEFWRQQAEEMGYLIDMDNPYITLENDYIESVWWILDQFYKGGMVYEGHKILPYCSRCGTGLASHEVAQGYKEIKQETVTVGFKRKDRDEYFLVWTTTPWTLASNVLLTVHPEVSYARVEQAGNTYIIAEKLVESVMGRDVRILETFPGKDLEYVEYEQLMPFIEVDKKAFFVTLAEYVTTEDGTGIVHTAPAFGEDDYNTSMKYDAPIIQPVNLEGKYTATPWKGMFVMDADALIIEWLREQGLLYKKQRMEHNYPHCWRCDTPLLYYATSSWYIRMSELRDQLVANNNTVDWHPDYIGEKRFGHWLENVKDWAISRSRYWGTPLNIWTCDCGHEESVGSIEELKNRSKTPIGGIELHRPYVDDVVFECPECGGDMHRVPYVVDVWFDSGSMPFAQLHYPFENKEVFDEYFPADYICEGIDQTRGWFYSLMAISTFIMKQSPFKNVLVNDMLLDKDGKKMSKSRGNIVDSFELFREQGADALRWYLNFSSPAWQPTKFDVAGLYEVQSKFFGTLKNIYHLFSLYANYDNLDVASFNLALEDRSLLDRWIITRLHRLIKDVTDSYEAYDLTRVTRYIQDFVGEDFSNWYVRRSRRRYWKEELDQDKKSVFLTTYEVLLAVVEMAAPIAPFVTEEIYRNLTGKTSVHLSDFPKYNEDYVDTELDASMDLVRKIVNLGRSVRESVAIKVRQPLTRVLVDVQYKEILGGLEPIILEELNVKEIEYVENISEYVDFVLKPNFPVLGPILGRKMGAFQKALREADATTIGMALRDGGKHELIVEGETVELTPELVEIQVEAKDQFQVQTQDALFVIMDTSITDELRDEGFAREFVSRIQQLRKQSGFEVADRINIKFNSTPDFEAAIMAYKDFVTKELLAESLVVSQNSGEEYLLNDQATRIEIERC
ncbi:MAG: isoleucine--tRNA ligase [Tissierellia bacterium]|nr:isoleucine--tRNA ligase [Tissierellia bacterium]